MVGKGEDKADTNRGSVPDVVSTAIDARRALAAILVRGVLRVLAKRQGARQTTCLSAASKPCLDTVNTERSR